MKYSEMNPAKLESFTSLKTKQVGEWAIGPITISPESLSPYSTSSSTKADIFEYHSLEFEQISDVPVSTWHPVYFRNKGVSNDVNVIVEGRKFSNISQLQKSVMIQKWKDEDEEYLMNSRKISTLFNINTLEEPKVGENTHSSCDIPCQNKKKAKLEKIRSNTLKKQIKEAIVFEKLFGEWVRKDWITDEKEQTLWNEIEQKIMMKEHKNEDLSSSEHALPMTVEEMKTLLQELSESSEDGTKRSELELLIEESEKIIKKEQNWSELTDLERFWIQSEKDGKPINVEDKKSVKDDISPVLPSKQERFLSLTSVQRVNEIPPAEQISDFSRKSQSSWHSENAFDGTFTQLHSSFNPRLCISTMTDSISAQVSSNKTGSADCVHNKLFQRDTSSSNFRKYPRSSPSSFFSAFSPYEKDNVANDPIFVFPSQFLENTTYIPSEEKLKSYSYFLKRALFCTVDEAEVLHRFSDPTLRNRKIKRMIKNRQNVDEFVNEATKMFDEVRLQPPIVVFYSNCCNRNLSKAFDRRQAAIKEFCTNKKHWRIRYLEAK
ncbi:uncharacterized protein MONOS_5786 [Monocercomonoides exilis]|uniref:uncharacterized protein n=1 Tax=Monocercomonoides exilis TaxID=2049356 RepID=UPI00355A7EBB|nr:hypothetical protein MONOS_5786 [Monocercomonoides exilis]|eukprot:MONOS_5786.1-p1 / transcript=MONOS_5786.1 / gene=MONOS_5786 / organism=Monocercomonoides_exilis_PA203 / gene_product=unspecified product / transcript_product=unspecified product / location=Mono_scaffold00173:45804-47447(-) / protein_length=548 / sequence_SO=supercontig / SO=protein_coding / is_pseudo=false